MVETAAYVHSSAVPQLAEPASEPAAARSEPGFGVHANPNPERPRAASQPALFAHAPETKIVALPRQAGPLARPRAMKVAEPIAEAGFAELKARPRRRTSELQTGFAFPPPPPAAHQPFVNVLKPVQGIITAPLALRWWSLVVDAAIVLMLGVTALAGAALAFRIFHQSLSWDELSQIPWYIPALVPVMLSLGYKAIWAVGESATIGLQRYGLEVRCIDGSRPTLGQRMIRPFAGWIKVASVVGMLWPIVTQERYSMQDLVSQTVVTYCPGCEPDER
jgi:uncharacterized RDD family membrane protein YckC